MLHELSVQRRDPCVRIHCSAPPFFNGLALNGKPSFVLLPRVLGRMTTCRLLHTPDYTRVATKSLLRIL